MTTREQIDHIKAHQAEFDELRVEKNADVEAYFQMYSYIPDIYERVCDDLAIEPLPDNEAGGEVHISVHRHETEEEFYDAMKLPRPSYLPPKESS